MPHWHRLSCKSCGRDPAEGERISASGLCHRCGEAKHLEHNRQLRQHAGPWFEHWRRQTLAAFGVAVDTTGRPQ
jgi:hypothetical protein